MTSINKFVVRSFAGMEQEFKTRELATDYANELLESGMGAWVESKKLSTTKGEKFDLDTTLEELVES